METRFVTCEHCGGEGRMYVQGFSEHERDAGECPECHGERVVEIQVEPVTLDDL